MTNESEFKRPSNWDELFQNAVAAESDRAAVILSAAFLDSALELLLKAFLVPCAASTDPLFDSVSAPFGDFSGRIEAAYRLGLIEPTFARALHLIRKIRNDFAHNITGCTFADSSVMSRLTELAKCMELSKADLNMRSHFREGTRGDFELSVSYLQWNLHCTVERITPLNSNYASSCCLPQAVPFNEGHEAVGG